MTQQTTSSFIHPTPATAANHLSVARLIRWSGPANILAGILYGLGTYLHPPRDINTLAETSQAVSWEAVHTLGIISFVVTIFALIGLYARQFERSGRLGLLGFVLAVSGAALAPGALAPDSYIFPVLAGNPALDSLLAPASPILRGPFGVYLILSGLILVTGYLLFGIAMLRAGILPRAAVWLLLAGILPLMFGPLFVPFSDWVGATLVALGHIWLGWALWTEKEVKHDPA